MIMRWLILFRCSIIDVIMFSNILRHSVLRVSLLMNHIIINVGKLALTLLIAFNTTFVRFNSVAPAVKVPLFRRQLICVLACVGEFTSDVRVGVLLAMVGKQVDHRLDLNRLLHFQCLILVDRFFAQNWHLNFLSSWLADNTISVWNFRTSLPLAFFI